MCRQHAWDGDDCPYCDIDRLTKENNYLRYNSRKYYHADGSFNVLESEDEVIERRKSMANENKILRQKNDKWLEECEQLKAERNRLREELFEVGSMCTGETQIDVYGDTEALLFLAKKLGAYDDPPLYSKEVLKTP